VYYKGILNQLRARRKRGETIYGQGE